MIPGLIREVRAWSWERRWSEFWNLFKFGVVGVSSLGINVMAYTLLSRVIWVSGPRTLEAVLAVLLSAIYNFSMHYHWTFGARGFGFGMLSRYVAVAVLGTGLHGALFYIGHEVFGWYDIAVQIGAAFVIASATYFLHRRFTFQYRYPKETGDGDTAVIVETEKTTVTVIQEEE